MPTTVHDKNYRDLIARMIAARVDAGMTQAAVADELGRHQSYVAKVERCERRLDVIELFQLAEAIGIDPMPLLRATWKAVRDTKG